MKYHRILFIIMCMFAPLLYALSQIMRSYIIAILALFLYSISASYLLVHKHSKYLLLLLTLWNLSIWIAYYAVLTPDHFLVTGDLVFMSKVSEEIVAKGHYPFNNEYLISKRPNYVLYPTSFILQTILSMITSIDVWTLMYVPILMHVAILLVLLLTLLLMKKTPSELSLFAALPVLGFVTIRATVFIYSQITRALLYLLIYVFMSTFFVEYNSRKRMEASTIVVLALLAISSILGHSQEPITFSIFLALLTLFFVPLSRRSEKYSHATHLLQILTHSFLSTLFIYNIYIAMLHFQGTISFLSQLLRQLLIALFPEISQEVVIQKISIAQGLLTKEELVLVIAGFATTMTYVAILLLKHLIYALRSKNWYEIAFNLAIIVYGLIAISPLLIPGISADLFWRPLWTLFIALALWPLVTSHRHNQISRHLILMTIIIVTFFAFSSTIYSRLHLISSDVYVHESSTARSMVKISFIRSLQSSEPVRIVVLDSPNQPAYEITGTLQYMISDTKATIAVQALQPNIKWYRLSYLNGLPKLREYTMEYSSNIENEDDLYIFASPRDIPLISTILISKNKIFSSQNVVVFS